MFSHAIMLAILTHPVHVLLFGVILSRLAREVVSAAARTREAARVGSGRHRQPVALGPSGLRAA
jgi:hypothetical protein